GAQGDARHRPTAGDRPRRQTGTRPPRAAGVSRQRVKTRQCRRGDRSRQRQTGGPDDGRECQESESERGVKREEPLSEGLRRKEQQQQCRARPRFQEEEAEAVQSHAADLTGELIVNSLLAVILSEAKDLLLLPRLVPRADSSSLRSSE